MDERKLAGESMKVGDLVRFYNLYNEWEFGVIIGKYREYPSGVAWRIRDAQGLNTVYMESGLRLVA